MPNPVTEEQSEPKIKATEAVRLASEYFNELFRGKHVERLLLEEIWIDNDRENWYVTLGFDVEIPREVLPLGSPAWGQQFVEPLPKEFKRYYKLFTVDAKSGEVRSMKIRTPENA